LLHVSVMAWFMWRQRSGRWIRYLIVPLAGFSIIAYVLVNMDVRARTLGAIWLATGIAITVLVKLFGGKSALPLE